MTYRKAKVRAANPPASDTSIETAYVEMMADEHMAAFLSHVVENSHNDAAERKAIIAKFNAIPRRDYHGQWNRDGCKRGTNLWRASLRELMARTSDELFRLGMKNGAIVGEPDGRLIQRRMGLAGLLEVCEREWLRAHLAALGKDGAR